MAQFKRKEELVIKVAELLNNDKIEGEAREAVKELLNSYKNTTFKEWDDRHEFYYQMMDDMVNDCGFKDDELAEKMANNHPTLQQSFMRFVAKFIAKMSEKSYYDGRNEASVKLAKELKPVIEKEGYLPFI